MGREYGRRRRGEEDEIEGCVCRGEERREKTSSVALIYIHLLERCKKREREKKTKKTSPLQPSTVKCKAEMCYEQLSCPCPPPLSASLDGAGLTQQSVVSGWSVGEVSRAAEQTGFASILRDVIRVVLF